MPLSPIQLETRIQELLDGTLSEEHWPELMRELQESEEARRLYCKHSRMHGLLGQHAKGLRALTTPVPTIPIQQIIGKQRKKLIAYSSIAAAAIVLITLVALQFIFISKPEHSLAFETSPHTIYTLTHDTYGEPPKGAALVPGSRLQVSQGTVALHFETGVESILQAPADITLTSDNSLQIRKGTAWFHVPRQAQGFRVQTPDLDVVDLGTEFGIITAPGGQDEVHVFKGSVQVTSIYRKGESVELTKDQARVLDNVGRLEEIETNPSAFLTTLPDELPYIHWSFDGNDQLASEGTAAEAGSKKGKILGAHAEPSFQSTSGPFGEALRSLGNCGYVETNWKGIGGNAPRTLAYWIKLPSGVNYTYSYHTVGWGKFWGLFDTTTNQFYSFICTNDDGTSTCGISMGGFWTYGTTDLADDRWHHIAHVYTGKSLPDGHPETLTYVDGQFEATSNHSYSELRRDKANNIIVNTDIYRPDSHPLSLLAHSWDENRHGLEYQTSLDEIFVFSAALTAEQIENLYRHNSYKGEQ